MIEAIEDSMSIDSIKKKLPQGSTLLDYFRLNFGEENGAVFKKARDNFCCSLAGYSLVCYLLQIKDRHNGNIMIDIEGHLIHIDFGFLLSNAPGKGLRIEQAPFKLTNDFIGIIGGVKSKSFKKYRDLMIQGFMALQAEADSIIILVEMMIMGQSDLSCF